MLYFLPMEALQSFETTNFNAKWLDNLFQNIVKLEEFERLARNGVASTQEYITLLSNNSIETVKLMIVEIQYKNLANMVGEIITTLAEIEEIMKKEDLEQLKYKATIINRSIKIRSLFIEDAYSFTQNKVLSSKLTDQYYQALNEVCEMRREILRSLAPLRHVAKANNGKPF